MPSTTGFNDTTAQASAAVSDEEEEDDDDEYDSEGDKIMKPVKGGKKAERAQAKKEAKLRVNATVRPRDPFDGLATVLLGCRTT